MRVPVSADTWQLWTPSSGVSVSLPAEGSGQCMGVRDPVGGPGAPAVWLSAPFFGARGDTGPAPSGKLVRDCWSGEIEPDHWGLAAQLLRA